jgi:hypothetical protein
MKRLSYLILMVGFLFSAANTAVADIVWATELGPLGLNRGDTSIGNFSSWYGGTYPGSFPVPLTTAQAEAAILGAPDTQFLSLPGNVAGNPTEVEAAFQWAYVDVAFGTSFDAGSDLLIQELGNNYESVHLFLWFEGGGNLQLTETRGVDDLMVIDLDPYAGLVASYGNFSHVTLGGQDLLGASMGFDLDAVGITTVPEPASLILFGSGLLGALLGRCRRGRIQVEQA